MWVRGLKRDVRCALVVELYVAPYVGAWIETVAFIAAYDELCSRTLCGCVD